MGTDDRFLGVGSYLALCYQSRYVFFMPESEKKRTLFDPIRRKSVASGPEEIVRHAVIGFLQHTLRVPVGLIAVEKKLEKTVRTFRADLIIYDRAGNPWMVVECKAPGIQIGQRAFDQIGRYNRTLKAPYLMITNGHDFFCCGIEINTGKMRYLDTLPLFPSK